MNVLNTLIANGTMVASGLQPALTVSPSLGPQNEPPAVTDSYEKNEPTAYAYEPGWLFRGGSVARALKFGLVALVLLPTAGVAAGPGGSAGGVHHVEDPEEEKKRGAIADALAAIRSLPQNRVNFIGATAAAATKLTKAVASSKGVEDIQNQVRRKELCDVVLREIKSALEIYRKRKFKYGEIRALVELARVIEVRDAEGMNVSSLREIYSYYHMAADVAVSLNRPDISEKIGVLFRGFLRTIVTKDTVYRQIRELGFMRNSFDDEHLEKFAEVFAKTFVNLGINEYKSGGLPDEFGRLPHEYLKELFKKKEAKVLVSKLEEWERVEIDERALLYWLPELKLEKARNERDKRLIAEAYIRNAAMNGDFRAKFVENGKVTRDGVDSVLGALSKIGPTSTKTMQSLAADPKKEDQRISESNWSDIFYYAWALQQESRDLLPYLTEIIAKAHSMCVVIPSEVQDKNGKKVLLKSNKGRLSPEGVKFVATASMRRIKEEKSLDSGLFRIIKETEANEEPLPADLVEITAENPSQALLKLLETGDGVTIPRWAEMNGDERRGIISRFARISEEAWRRMAAEQTMKWPFIMKHNSAEHKTVFYRPAILWIVERITLSMEIEDILRNSYFELQAEEYESLWPSVAHVVFALVPYSSEELIKDGSLDRALVIEEYLRMCVEVILMSRYEGLKTYVEEEKRTKLFDDIVQTLRRGSYAEYIRRHGSVEPGVVIKAYEDVVSGCAQYEFAAPYGLDDRLVPDPTLEVDMDKVMKGLDE